MPRNLLSVALLSLLACAAPRGASARGLARSGPYALELVDEAGRALPTFVHGGRTYVLGARGGRYLLRVRNASPRRVEVVASVDGRDVLDGRPSALDKPGYVIAPWGEVTIDGFRLSTAEVAAFRFGSVEESYAARMGDARDVGVIGVAIFPEAPPPERRAWPEPRADAEEAPAPQALAEGKAASRAPGAAEERAAGVRRERPGLGTAFGEAHASPVEEVAFARASARPDAVLTLRYDDRRGLAALGIDVDGRRTAEDDRWLRRTAEPFRRDGAFAAPPPGWER